MWLRLLQEAVATKIERLSFFQHRGARGRKYGGHSSHVTNVRWNYDDRVLVSTGGLDTAVLVWDRLVVSEVDEPGENT